MRWTLLRGAFDQISDTSQCNPNPNLSYIFFFSCFEELKQVIYTAKWKFQKTRLCHETRMLAPLTDSTLLYVRRSVGRLSRDLLVWTPSWFYFSSLHFITVQSKIQYGDKLCFEFPTFFWQLKKQSKSQSKSK